MREPICVGYIRPVGAVGLPGNETYVSAVDVKTQEDSICEMAKVLGLELSQIYRDDAGGGAFGQMRRDAIYRSFDVLIVHSLYCFGTDLYGATDFLRDALIPAGFQVVFSMDGFLAQGGAETDEYFESRRDIYRLAKSFEAKEAKREERKNGGEDNDEDGTGQKKKHKRNIYKPTATIIALAEKRSEACVDGMKAMKPERLVAREGAGEVLRRMILDEVKKAEHVLDLLPQLAPVRDEMLDGYKMEQRRIFKEMADINAAQVPLYRELQSGNITEEEYKARRREIDARLEEADERMITSRAESASIAMLFSSDNPWIHRFAGAKLPDELTGRTAEKWVSKSAVGKDEDKSTDQHTCPDIWCQFKFSEWRDALLVNIPEDLENDEIDEIKEA